MSEIEKARAEFHWNHGVTFTRVGGISSTRPDLEFGTVHVRFYKDGGRSKEIERELFIPPYEWCSVVASVSNHGEDGFSHGLVKALHEVTPLPTRVPEPGPCRVHSPIAEMDADCTCEPQESSPLSQGERARILEAAEVARQNAGFCAAPYRRGYSLNEAAEGWWAMEQRLRAIAEGPGE